VLARPEREADQMASSDAQVIEKARQIAREESIARVVTSQIRGALIEGERVAALLWLSDDLPVPGAERLI
jgi:hypothetical protein